MNARKNILSLLLFSALILGGCIQIDNYGPHGRTGKAYFGIDSDWSPPYSYWDNNQSIPSNPFLGEFYRTQPGRFNFEYFINPSEYWYGTYEIWEIRGEPGLQNGRPGRDGPDNYLMLICNPNGFYFDDWQEGHSSYRSADTLIFESQSSDQRIRIEMIRTTRQERAPQEPKYIEQR